MLGPDNRSDTREYRINLTLANPGDIPCFIDVEIPQETPGGETCPWAAALPS